VRDYGFGGAAFLGYVWQGDTSAAALKRKAAELRRFETR